MKIYLNILGALAIAASFASMLVAERLAEGVGMALAGLVVSGFLLGAGRMVELAEAEHAAATKHRALEVEFMKLQATRGHGPGEPPVMAGAGR